MYCCCFSFTQSCPTHGLQHASLPCPSLSSKICSNSCPLSQWCYPTVLSWLPSSIKTTYRGGVGSDRGWDGWMVQWTLTQWTWVWANSRRWWRTGKTGMLQSMGLQRVGNDWVIEGQQKERVRGRLKPQSICNPTCKVTYHYFENRHFIKSKSLCLSHT